MQKQIALKEEFHLHYNWCGKFESPSPEWMHLTRDLIDFELMIVTEGTLYIADSNKNYVLNKGDYLLMPPDHFQHGYRQSDCSFYWLHFYIPQEEYQLFHLFSSTEEYPISFFLEGTLSFPERIIILMKQLQDSDKRYHNPKLNDALCLSILLELYSQSSSYRNLQGETKSLQIYNDIMDYIRYHACENILVSDIAKYFGYNEKYLSTFFKKHAGIPLKQFIIQSKMDLAKAELTDTNHSISQIAYNIGFSDAHNFTNAFKKFTGVTPSSFRESYDKRALFHQ